jgi:hypothetical protein
MSAHARETRVEDGDADFDAPKTRRVEGPANDLDLGPQDAVSVFLRVGRQGGALLVGHVAVGEALGLAHDERRRHRDNGAEYL